MDKEGQPCETQYRSGNGNEDTILLLVTVFNDALVPPGARTEFPTAHEDITEEEYRKDLQCMHKMAVQVGVNVYMNVLQLLPIPLRGAVERKTFNLIQLARYEAIGSPFMAIHHGGCENGFPDYGAVLMRNFDAELKKVLEGVDFEDYDDNQKVPKHAIRKALLEEIRPLFYEILTEVRNKTLEKFFK
ncbi:hypothetical protein PDIG_72540 [Penicillium digitatum PHI26]|uniref:Uncharacterized protein n=3 Tax=Penicillium digitatum TaxID=36651 RepID=K9FXK3_PEND2|nr:hypothetical protein PDIP_43010 [Penicillium digitatum Pd1]EKV07393.1 hypothetical protein PDIG_72540 [Penicillium digitatum PHI26]EKV14605.1 hypothetical protein PDIP_43010 [Penicillium digitatum Pd1]